MKTFFKACLWCLVAFMVGLMPAIIIAMVVVLAMVVFFVRNLDRNKVASTYTRREANDDDDDDEVDGLYGMDYRDYRKSFLLDSHTRRRHAYDDFLSDYGRRSSFMDS